MQKRRFIRVREAMAAGLTAVGFQPQRLCAPLRKLLHALPLYGRQVPATGGKHMPKVRLSILISAVAVTASILFPSAAVASQASQAGTLHNRPISTAGESSVIPHTSGWHYNQLVGIDVVGTGLQVSAIYGSGFDGDECGNASWYVYDTDGYLISTSNPVSYCNGSPGTYITSFLVLQPLRSFPSGDQICDEYLGVNAPMGNPCITLHP